MLYHKLFSVDNEFDFQNVFFQNVLKYLYVFKYSNCKIYSCEVCTHVHNLMKMNQIYIKIKNCTTFKNVVYKTLSESQNSMHSTPT